MQQLIRMAVSLAKELSLLPAPTSGSSQTAPRDLISPYLLVPTIHTHTHTLMQTGGGNLPNIVVPAFILSTQETKAGVSLPACCT